MSTQESPRFTLYRPTASKVTKEMIHFHVSPSLVTVMWFLKYSDGLTESEPIEIDSWFENYDHPDRPKYKLDGRYSFEDARWIWNSLVEHVGFIAV